MIDRMETSVIGVIVRLRRRLWMRTCTTYRLWLCGRCYVLAMVALGDVGWRMAEIVAGRGTEHRQTESFLRAWVGDRQKLKGISTNRLFVGFNGRQADELKGM
jgi:hypothetical protein